MDTSTPSKKRTQSSSGTLQTTESRDLLLQKDRYRIAVMGASKVGKSCVVSRLMHDKFRSEHRATVEELHTGLYELNGVPLTLDILDTSGTYEFPAMRRLCISTSDAFLLVFSVDDESSFEELNRFLEEINDEKQKRNTGNGIRTPIVIIANKTDLEPEVRRIQSPTARATANIVWESGYVEVSAKEGRNMGEIFKELLSQADMNLQKLESTKETESTGSCVGGWMLLRRSKRHSSSKRKSPKRKSCIVS